MPARFKEDLFVCEGNRMVFNVSACADAGELQEFVELGGGSIDASEEEGPYSITLVNRGSDVSSAAWAEDAFSSDFILKCCLYDKILPLNDYWVRKSSRFNKYFNPGLILRQRFSWPDALQKFPKSQSERDVKLISTSPCLISLDKVYPIIKLERCDALARKCKLEADAIVSGSSSNDESDVKELPASSDSANQPSHLNTVDFRKDSNDLEIGVVKESTSKDSTVRVVSRIRGRKRYEYSHHERKNMIDFIVKQDSFDKIAGTVLWKRMEKVVPRHTWQSLKKHFETRILPAIEDYDLPIEVMAKFRYLANTKVPRPLETNSFKICKSDTSISRSDTENTADIEDTEDSENDKQPSSSKIRTRLRPRELKRLQDFNESSDSSEPIRVSPRKKKRRYLIISSDDDNAEEDEMIQLSSSDTSCNNNKVCTDKTTLPKVTMSQETAKRKSASREHSRKTISELDLPEWPSDFKPERLNFVEDSDLEELVATSVWMNQSALSGSGQPEDQEDDMPPHQEDEPQVLSGARALDSGALSQDAEDNNNGESLAVESHSISTAPLLNVVKKKSLYFPRRRHGGHRAGPAGPSSAASSSKDVSSRGVESWIDADEACRSPADASVLKVTPRLPREQDECQSSEHSSSDSFRLILRPGSALDAEIVSESEKVPVSQPLSERMTDDKRPEKKTKDFSAQWDLGNPSASDACVQTDYVIVKCIQSIDTSEPSVNAVAESVKTTRAHSVASKASLVSPSRQRRRAPSPSAKDVPVKRGKSESPQASGCPTASGSDGNVSSSQEIIPATPSESMEYSPQQCPKSGRSTRSNKKTNIVHLEVNGDKRAPASSVSDQLGHSSAESRRRSLDEETEVNYFPQSTDMLSSGVSNEADTQQTNVLNVIQTNAHTERADSSRSKGRAVKKAISGSPTDKNVSRQNSGGYSSSSDTSSSDRQYRTRNKTRLDGRQTRSGVKRL